MSVSVVTRFNHIPGVTPKCEAGAAAALNMATGRCIQAADPLTRVDTGAMKANKEITNASAGSLRSGVRWLQDYSIYQNSGTIHISGTHFADTGAEHARPGLVADMTAVGYKLA